MAAQRIKAMLIFVVTKIAVKLFCYAFVKLRVHGLDNLPRDTGAIVVANHRSKLDGFLMYSLMDRMIYSFIKSDYFRNPLVSWYLRGGGGIPVKKGEFRPSSIRDAKRALTIGGILLVFPEGQVNRTGQLLPFEKTFMKLALKYRVPIVPVTIIGTDHALPGGRWLPRSSRVEIIIKEPIVFHDIRKKDFIDGCVEQVRSIIINTLKRFEGYGARRDSGSVQVDLRTAGESNNV